MRNPKKLRADLWNIVLIRVRCTWNPNDISVKTKITEVYYPIQKTKQTSKNSMAYHNIKNQLQNQITENLR